MFRGGVRRKTATIIAIPQYYVHGKFSLYHYYYVISM